MTSQTEGLHTARGQYQAPIELEMLHDFLFSCAVLSLSAPYCVKFAHFGSESAKLGDNYPIDIPEQHVPEHHCRISNDEYICETDDFTILTIPCGTVSPQPGVAFTYYIKENGTILALQSAEFLHLVPNWSDSGKHVCCRAHLSVAVPDVCYRLNVTFAPIAGPLVWLSGYPIQPIFGERFGLRCPLEANPTPVYRWKKFATLDMAEPVNLTEGVTFAEDGRVLMVDSYTEEYNGMYVCFASNSLGVAQYVNVGLFYLYTDRCIRQQSMGTTLHISPSGLVEGRPGGNVTLTCTAVNTVLNAGDNGRPYWWVERNENPRERCDLPNYTQESSFDELHCKWTAVLTIHNFSSHLIGRYFCGYHNNIGRGHLVNQTVQYEACYINSERDDISLAITPENSTYTEGTDILLSCTASSAAPNDGYAPVWILPYNNALDCPHGISNECNSSSHEVLDASFDNEHCQWTSSIIVKGFRKSQEGTYTCQVGNHERKIALQLLYREADSVWKRMSSSRKAATVLTGAVSALVTIIFLRRCMRISYIKSKEPPYDGFKHDVFVSFADEAKDFAEHKIIFPLMSECSPPYKVSWHLQDFIAGLTIEEQIMEAVMQSRKIIFVFSENFMKSSWCALELQYALHRLLKTQTRCVIPIAVSDGAVPKELKRRITYWPIVNIVKEGDLRSRMSELIGDRIPHLNESSVECDYEVEHAEDQ